MFWVQAEQIRDMHDLVQYVRSELLDFDEYSLTSLLFSPAVIAPTPQRPSKQFGAGRRREGVV